MLGQIDVSQKSSDSSISNICNVHIQLRPQKLPIDTAQTPLSSLQAPSNTAGQGMALLHQCSEFL